MGSLKVHEQKIMDEIQPRKRNNIALKASTSSRKTAHQQATSKEEEDTTSREEDEVAFI